MAVTAHPERIRYGPLPSQFAELWPGPQDGGSGIAVLLHGGWWRAWHGLDQLDPMAADLAGRGWSVANVEYRRTAGDGGGWPVTLDDVIEAVGAVRNRCDGGPLVAIGHSAGGHLALLAAAGSAVDAAVALAPVTDLARCAAAGLGEGATPLFAGAESFREASPRYRLPLGAPHLVVHGDRDERVPVEHSRDYVAAASDEVDYVELPGVDHFAVIDPAQPGWASVCRWLDGGFRRTAGKLPRAQHLR